MFVPKYVKLHLDRNVNSADGRQYMLVVNAYFEILMHRQLQLQIPPRCHLMSSFFHAAIVTDLYEGHLPRSLYEGHLDDSRAERRRRWGG
eukprot:163388-Pyramimonas_sp.AAC.1